jgi:hypothetical protein
MEREVSYLPVPPDGAARAAALLAEQFLVRDSSITGWSNGVWNQVFSGVQGAPAQSFPNPPYTTLPTTPVSKERPFLYLDSAGKYRVFVPALRENSSGSTWQSGTTAGRSIPISDFYLAKPSDTSSTTPARR